MFQSVSYKFGILFRCVYPTLAYGSCSATSSDATLASRTKQRNFGLYVNVRSWLFYIVILIIMDHI